MNTFILFKKNDICDCKKNFKLFFHIKKFVIKHLLVRRILLVIYLSQMFTQIDTEGN